MNQPQPVQQPMTPQGGTSKWLWITLIIVILAAAGYFAWTYLGKSKTGTTTTTASNSEAVKDYTITDAPDGQKIFVDTKFDFSIKYPSTWKINNENLEKSTDTDLLKGNKYIQIYQGEEDNMTKKLEISFNSTKKELSELITERANLDVKYQELGKVTSVGNDTWTYGKERSRGVGDHDIFMAFSVINKNYDQSTNKANIYAVGYVFVGDESSKYTDEDALVYKDIISTFQFTK